VATCERGTYYSVTSFTGQGVANGESLASRARRLEKHIGTTQHKTGVILQGHDSHRAMPKLTERAIYSTGNKNKIKKNSTRNEINRSAGGHSLRSFCIDNILRVVVTSWIFSNKQILRFCPLSANIRTEKRNISNQRLGFQNQLHSNRKVTFVTEIVNKSRAEKLYYSFKMLEIITVLLVLALSTFSKKERKLFSIGMRVPGVTLCGHA